MHVANLCYQPVYYYAASLLSAGLLNVFPFNGVSGICSGASWVLFGTLRHHSHHDPLHSSPFYLKVSSEVWGKPTPHATHQTMRHPLHPQSTNHSTLLSKKNLLICPSPMTSTPHSRPSQIDLSLYLLQYKVLHWQDPPGGRPLETGPSPERPPLSP